MKKNFEDCRFCGIADGFYTYPGVDEPIANNDEFLAIATIGALVDGWTLIIPKKHQISMRTIYSNPNFPKFINKIIKPIVNQYGSLLAFEHGANKKGSLTGCGTDHAHLHLVPFNESLLPDMFETGFEWIRVRASEIEAQTKHNEYLFYLELGKDLTWNDQLGFLYILHQPVSQFFRKVIAQKTGNVDIVNYQQYPCISTSRRTRQMLSMAVA